MKLNGIIIKVIASSLNSYFNSIPTTLSNNINNNILTLGNYLVDKIPEAENFQPSSIQEITKIITRGTEIYRRGNVENGWKSLIMANHAWKCQ